MRTIRPNTTLIHEPEEIQHVYPTTKPVVQYIRQSSDGQVKKNKQSTILQDAGLDKLLTRRGFTDIIKIDTDQGKSGQKRPDEREGLNRLIKMVRGGHVGAVAAYDASRFYRDLTRVFYTDFVHMCEVYQVPVITYARTFWPDSTTDMADLIDEFKRAAKYIEEQILHKMLPAKMQAIELGQSYGGGSIPVGYTVTETEERKYYKIYEPHAEKVRYLYRRYRELDGNLGRLGQEIRATGFRFPPFEGVEKIPHLSLHWDGKGYPLKTRKGLVSILSNPAYLGWYTFNGVIISKEAHDPIVDRHDFMYAFSRLSGTTLDGDINEDRPKVERRSGTATHALLEGVLESDGNPVYVQAIKNRYIARTAITGWETAELVVNIDDLDKAFTRVLKKILTTLELRHQQGLQDSLYEQINALQEQKEEEGTDLSAQLVQVAKAIRQAELDKKVALEEEYEQGVREATRDLKRLHGVQTALEAKVNEAGNEEAELSECKNLIECAVNCWDSLPFERQRRLVKLLVSRANMTEAAPHFIKLEVVLKEPISGVFTIHLFRKRGRWVPWSEEENEIISRMYPYEDRATILHALPNRAWRSIVQHAVHTTPPVERFTMLNTSSIPEMLAMQDVELMRECGITNTKQTGLKIDTLSQ